MIKIGSKNDDFVRRNRKQRTFRTPLFLPLIYSPGDLEKIGAHVDDDPHQHPAGGAALDRELRGGGELEELRSVVVLAVMAAIPRPRRLLAYVF